MVPRWAANTQLVKQRARITTQAASMHAASTAFVWFRRDLRLADHEPLHEASKRARMVPVYVLDPQDLQPRWPGEGLAIPKLGPHRCRFLLQALHALRASLQRHHSDLVFRMGAPQAALLELLRAACADSKECQHVDLFFHADVLPESAELERSVTEAFTAAAADLGVSCAVKPFWSLTLYHPDDLPYQQFRSPTGKAASTAGSELHQAWSSPDRYRHLPSVMTQFRKAVQSAAPVRPCFPVPERLPPLPCGDSGAAVVDAGVIPQHAQQVYEQAGVGQLLASLQSVTGQRAVCKQDTTDTDPRTAFPFKAGERAGMERLLYYLRGNTSADAPSSSCTAPALHYFENTRMQAFGVDNSTKLSPFMALGCLSPRIVQQQVLELQQQQQQQADGGASNPAQWLIMHLCIRDFFIFTALKEGRVMMSEQGIKGQPLPWSRDMALFERWASGSTGLPFVDACMRELAATGYMSNRGRQNVASFLTKDLRIDWRLGAELFECLLLDHDPAVNYCNWNYFAGIGNDPRNRHFKTVTQGMKYDADASLIKAWVPELAALPPLLCHQPFSMTQQERDEYRFDLQTQYLEPVVDARTQIGKDPTQR